MVSIKYKTYVHGLVQDHSSYIANSLELLQSGTNPSIYGSMK